MPCRNCGNDTVVSGGCVVCGAGVKYVRTWKWGRRKRKDKPCRHRKWGYEGITYETGVKARKEVCLETKGCPEFRLTEVE